MAKILFTSAAALSLWLHVGPCVAFVATKSVLPVKSAWHSSSSLPMTATDDGTPRNRRDILKTISSAGALSAIAASSPILPASCASAASDPDLSFLGPLAALVGTWSGSGGLSITSVPSRKSIPSAVGAAELIIRPYREVLTIQPIPDAVKQRGGSIEQFSGVATYNKEVWATDEEELIHVEDGMFFYLDNVQLYSDGTPGGKLAKDDKPPFSIARSATVPHGTSAMLFGNYKISNGPPTIPDIDARPKPTIEGVQYDSPYIRSSYSAVNPNQDLKKAVKDQKIIKTTHISLDSRNEGAVTNTPFLKSRAHTTGFKCDFWLETVKGQDGKNVQQLQYSEIVDIFFHRTKGGGEDDLINWPHVMINTMTKTV